MAKPTPAQSTPPVRHRRGKIRVHDEPTPSEAEEAIQAALSDDPPPEGEATPEPAPEYPEGFPRDGQMSYEQRRLRYDAVATAADPLQLLPKEHANAHRAFLLWGMQIRDYPNTRAVGRAMRLTERAIRYHHNSWCWDYRIKRVNMMGRESEQACADLYRRLYAAEFAKTELPEVAPFCRADIGMATPKRRTADPATEAAALARADEAVKKTAQAKAVRKMEARASFRTLIGFFLANGLKAAKDDKIKYTVGDLLELARLKAELDAEEHEDDATETTAVVESVRVRMARQSGGDLLAAMRADLTEIGCIVSALEVQREAVTPDAEILRHVATAGPATGGPARERAARGGLHLVTEDEADAPQDVSPPDDYAAEDV